MTKKMTQAEKKAVLEDYKGLQAELDISSDRAMAILWPTILDEKLAILLRSFLVKGKVSEDLFEFRQPLGAFSDRIKLAYALGLLTDFEFQDLEIIRKIRNEFAHGLHGLSLADPNVKSMCGSFVILKKYQIDDTDPKSLFYMACYLILIRLNARIGTFEQKDRRLKPYQDTGIYVMPILKPIYPDFDMSGFQQAIAENEKETSES